MPHSDLIGIDLGTTNSAIAHLDAYGKPVVIPSAEGRPIVPSVVQLREDGTALVGDEAKHAIALEKEHTAQFFKRDMGTDASYSYRGRLHTPVTLSAEVLKKLKADAEAALGHPVRRAVITVPAYFQDAARLATCEAGKLAGLEVLQVVNEPTAAALAYGLGNRPGRERVLVYDLGGGTFDVTLVELDAGVIRVLATDGNHFLGGKDWDDTLMRHVCERFEAEQGVDPLDDAYAYQEILVRVEEAKKTLSERARATVLINCLGKMARIEVTREDFDARTADLLHQTESLVRRVLADAGVALAEVDAVLMVGGSTRMPQCGALVQRLFGKAPTTSVNPDECVAIGAVIQGALTLGVPEQPTGATRLLPARVQDVMSHSLGMIAVSADESHYLNSILIPKNRPIPATETRPFRAKLHGPAGTISVYVTQGEDAEPAHCTFVGKYVVSGIEARAGESPVLDIAYAYDASGIVTVAARQRDTGRALTVTKEAVPADMSWLHERPGAAHVVVPKTIYLAIDLSGSMAGHPLAQAQAAMRGFVRNCDMSHMSVGLIGFANHVAVHEQACRDARRLEAAIGRLAVSSRLGYGNEGDPFEQALQLLAQEPGQRFVLVLADGVWDDQRLAIQRARACHEAGIDVIAIGFGGADHAFLRAIASTDEGSIFTTNLQSAFENIAQVLVEGGERLALRRG
jgi:molecular chaperone DnaK (HSP70)